MAVTLLGAACQKAPQPDAAQTGATAADPALAALEALRFGDVAALPGPFAPPPQLGVEVALDRLGFSSGVIDATATRFDAAALRAFQSASGIAPSGQLDPATLAALQRANVAPVRTVRIPTAFAAGPFVADLPRETAKQAGFDRLGYRDLGEALAERFHTTPELLVALNPPDTRFAAGGTIRVPNVADVKPSTLEPDPRGWSTTLMLLGVSPVQPRAERIVVSKSAGTLQVFDARDRLIAHFPVTTGSAHDPLPLGDWTVLGVSRNPDYHFNPKLFWDAKDNQPDRLLKPGPNSPVGVVWIDLSKEHYGIHGTPEPALIGRTESHGCVRLTNWDAARLAQMVGPKVKVSFVR